MIQFSFAELASKIRASDLNKTSLELHRVVLFEYRSTVIKGLRIEPATLDDLPELTEMLFELFSQESDFVPDRKKEMRGLRLLLEQPSRGRVFVLRSPNMIIRDDQLADHDQHRRRRICSGP